MSKVNAYLEKRIIPTYGLGRPEINPLFFEKRVYQGSCGKVYPVPFIDKVFDEKHDKPYDAAILENNFVRLVLLPELGGRIFRAQDKSNHNYDFFYPQEVIKPALVGLAGPWISGGVEFNWPQHHRPGTWLPTEVTIEEEADGAKTVWMSEYDPMNRMKGMHGIRLRPDSSLIELRGRLYNRTPLTQTFLWWANVAVKVHDAYQSFFPPDVHYIADHAVRDMSSFPIAENPYYGVPYQNRPGQNDLRCYQNIPVPTSYMVCETAFDFFGGYDFAAEGGFIHVANRHIAPGKKQWTWGCEKFGRAWDRELSDSGDPYFELMAGVYTDNQPDFSYLLPYETKTFSQFWWSYKKIGPVQNANRDLAIRLVIQQGNLLDIGVAASRKFENLQLVLKMGSREKRFQSISVSPENPWIDKTIEIVSREEGSVSFTILDAQGRELLTCRHSEPSRQRTRQLAKEPAPPLEVPSSGELALIGDHLELYRHPTRYPEPYWEEAVKRDPANERAHCALGRAELKRGNFGIAEGHFRKAIEILTRHHPNPASGEALYFAGLTALYLNKTDEAYALLYKSTWNFEWRSAAYYRIALIDTLRNDYTQALAHIEASLDTNRQNNKAWVLKAIVNKRLGLNEAAREALASLAKADALDPWAQHVEATISGRYDEFLKRSRNDAQTLIDIAFDYCEAGFCEEAIELLQLHHSQEPTPCAVPTPLQQTVMTRFLLAWLFEKSGRQAESDATLKALSTASYHYFFPSRIQEQVVLEWAVQKEEAVSLAAYGLGNYYYNLKRHHDAISSWEKAASRECRYGTLYRNLGIAWWNIQGNGQKAREAFETAVKFSPDDMRIHYEFDQLRKKLNDSPTERLVSLGSLGEKVRLRDDFSVELAALYNFTGQYEKALTWLGEKTFHPWEGGEGQVLRQYSYACLQLGQQALQNGKPHEALRYFEQSLNTPHNLGEKYHPLQAVAHINYWKGRACKALQRYEEANHYFAQSAREEGDFVDMAVSAYSELSYYKALSLMELQQPDQALELLQNIARYGEAKLRQKARIDYFATSLPLLLVFEDDLQKKQTIEATYLMGLAALGAANRAKAAALFEEVLRNDAMHMGAHHHLLAMHEPLEPTLYDLESE